MIRIEKIKARRYSNGPVHDDVFVFMDKKEAAAVITSLADQLHKPGGGLPDFAYGKGLIRKGAVVFAVQDPLVCFSCQAEIKPYTGKMVRDVLVCMPCYKKKYCEYCRGFGGHADWCTDSKVRNLVRRFSAKEKRKKRK